MCAGYSNGKKMKREKKSSCTLLATSAIRAKRCIKCFWLSFWALCQRWRLLTCNASHSHTWVSVCVCLCVYLCDCNKISITCVNIYCLPVEPRGRLRTAIATMCGVWQGIGPKKYCYLPPVECALNGF